MKDVQNGVCGNQLILYLGLIVCISSYNSSLIFSEIWKFLGINGRILLDLSLALSAGSSFWKLVQQQVLFWGWGDWFFLNVASMQALNCSRKNFTFSKNMQKINNHTAACFVVHLLHIFKIPFDKNTFRGLLHSDKCSIKKLLLKVLQN